jgi:hypothetical protein
MPREEAVLNRQLVRQARPPAMGNSSNEAGAGRLNDSLASNTTVIDEEGNVRRLWQPGDPWGDGTPGSSAFYFGDEN